MRRGVERKNTVYHGTVGAGTHARGIGAVAGKQAQGGDNHGLTCTGLAGDYGQARIELGGRFLDHTEITDVEFLQHISGADPSNP